MKSIGLITLLLVGQLGYAKVNCTSPTEKVTIDPKRKIVEITRNGESKAVEIIGENHNAYQIFGDSTYELEGGYILGLKPLNSKSKAQRLTVFRNGSPVASLSECTKTRN